MQDQSRLVTRPAGRSVDWSVTIDNQLADEDVMQISGAGHWFLEGWIGDHAVDFLVDSGSAVIAVSCSFYKNLVEARAPVGDLQPTARKLRGANGSQIDILGCSSCVVSFLGLQTEFPILVCDLSTDAIIGTETPYCLKHWTSSMDCYLRKEVCLSNDIVETQHYLDASSLWDIVQFRRTLRQSFTALPAQWVAGPCRPVGCWKA